MPAETLRNCLARLPYEVPWFIRRLFRAIRAFFFPAAPEVPGAPHRPATYEEAVAFVAARIKPDTVSDPHFHFSGGMALRNGLGLWDKESPLHRHMLERFGLCHADDTGTLIAKAADAWVNGRAYSPDADVAFYQEYWRLAGLNPATMEPLKNRG